MRSDPKYSKFNAGCNRETFSKFFLVQILFENATVWGMKRRCDMQIQVYLNEGHMMVPRSDPGV